MFYNLTKNYNNFINSIGTNIINGPFKGMKYISESVGSCHMPKILGIYENEIYPTLLNFLSNSDLFVDIGAAEGYYAVGSAIKYPHLNVIAYEMDKTGREYISNLKKRNNLKHFRSVNFEDMSKKMVLNNLNKVIITDNKGQINSILNITELENFLK